MADAQMGLTTVMMVLLFGTNLCLYILFQLMQRFPTGRVTYEQVQQDTDEDEDDKVVKGSGGQKAVMPVASAKKLSEPFVGSVDCFTNLTHELFRTGCILALTYICEKHWYTDHLGKTYDRDLFVFVLLLFFGYAFLTTKKTEDASLLSPDQTLEWKGWMQFIFLLYHYFHAEEVYNSVRVMITCYVWMTGFGQFSSYYMKQDFGWLKVSHNLWRLNFAVLLLMWTHGNTYILYYICPMHTFYFLMVYVSMYLYSSLNHTKWGIRYKLAALGVLIFIIWDVNGGLFDVLFAWLGTDSVVGATNGSVWEYYFRTSLDHWSSFLGMIFALNYPMADQFLTKVRGWPLFGTSVVMAVLSVWWYLVFYTQEKMAYNLTHSYFAIIPLTAYIFFRNVSMRLRRFVSHSLVDLGKTTLETYLLQHHIWLTSNAKTLLNITPGYPWVNFFLASMLFVLCSKELYRITTSLRGMMLPDEKFPDAKSVALNNIAGMGAVLLTSLTVATLLHVLKASLLEACLACTALFLATTLVIGRFAKGVANNPSYQLWLPRATYAALAVLALGTATQLVINSMSPPAPPIAFAPRPRSCLEHISHGKWAATKCPDASSSPGREPKAFCETDSWVWEPLSAEEASEDSASVRACPVAKVSNALAKAAFKNKRIVFAGDSILRNSYHAFNSLLDPAYKFNASVSFRHGNLVQQQRAINASVSFYWAPMVSNISATVDVLGRTGGYDLLVCGAAAWDALYIRSVPSYLADLNALTAKLKSPLFAAPAVSVWLQPTTIVDNRLTTLEKQQYIGERTIAGYRAAFSSSPASSQFSVTLDPTGASKSREGATVDGIHYSEDIYKVIAQMCANAYNLHFPQLYVRQAAAPKVGKAKPTGSMSFPSYGFVVLVAAAVMLYTMDSFFGIAWVVQRAMGVSDQQASDLTWEVAYRDVHRKHGIAHPSSSGSVSNSRSTSERGDSDRENESSEGNDALGTK